MPGKQTLGDLVSSIDYIQTTCFDGGPGHPVSRLRKLMEKRLYDCRITFSELKEGYKAFEKKICINDFPEAGTPGCEVACKTAEVLSKLTDAYLELHGEMFMTVSEFRFHALVSLIQAGLNSTHVKLLWFTTEGWNGLASYIRMMEPDQLMELLKTLKITFRYPRNNELDEEAYISTLRSRLADIFEKIGLHQYKPTDVHREFLDLYLYYNTVIPGLSEKMAFQVYLLTRNMTEKFHDGNPYLGLKDVNIFKKHLSTVLEMICCMRYKSNGPIDDAAKAMVENMMKAIIEDDLVTNLFDDIMESIVKIYQNSNARKEAGLVINKFRTFLIREIGDRKIAVKPLLKSCFPMLNKVLEFGGISSDTRRLVEDVINIFIKEAKPL